MKLIYLKNFRSGFATNSSSTHSLIYKNKDDMFKDLNIFELNYYDRFDSTIAASREAKIKYIAAYCYYDKFLFEIMCKYYPEMEQYIPLIEYQRAADKMPYDYSTSNVFGMYTRGAFTISGQENLEFNIKTLRNIIDSDDIIIVGGSDEMDFVYDTCKDHKEVTTADDLDKKYVVVKNGNYWVGINEWGGNRMRFNQKPDECIPEYPELIDLKITDKCDHGCLFCYMGSSLKGNHADISFLKRIIYNLSSDNYSNYKRRVEFAIGGGNILLYPNLEELFKYIKERGHIINTTINAKDAQKICEDDDLKKMFNEYVSGLGISVSSEDDLNILAKYDIRQELNNCKYVLHLIPEMLGVELTRTISERAYKMGYYKKLFLGYKTNNRGATKNHVKFTKDDLNKLFEDLYSVGVDTTFANTYKDWLKDNFETDMMITWNEGEYSMYIDGVEEKAYKSSYQLDKPYSLKYTNYKEKNINWFTVIDAFSHIREDNGFKVYKEE